MAATPTAVIANGESLSTAIQVGRHLVTGFLMPSSWTAADLTFTGAASRGGTHGVIKDSDGTELTVSAAASIFISLTSAEMDILSGAVELKIRSGPSAVPVAQGAERSIVVVLK